MTWKTQVTAIFLIAYFYGFLALRRTPIIFVAIFLTPLSFLFFLYVIAPHSVLPFGVVGGVVFTALFTGNGMMNDCAYLRLERQIQQVFITSPLRPIGWVLGMAVGELAWTIPAIALFLVVLALVVPLSPLAVLGLIGLIVLTWLMSSSLGFLLSTFFRTLREIWPIGTVVFTALSVLPPIFYPITAIPTNFRWVAFVSPSTFSSQLADRAAGLSVPTIAVVPALSSIPIEVAGMVGLTLLFAVMAMRLARWREP
jgi:ABC-2 type transport system permease protein